ncbi:MAG: alpha/beta fold hydrolase [Chitinophagaceae bacterium]|nr:alpha/beta fold hydrolase [Chitinophagaceae bacterium]
MSFFIFIFAAMQKTVMKRVWKWIRIIASFYIVCGIALYFLQEKFLFHPKKLPPDYKFSFSVPFKEINLAINNERNLSIVQFTVPDSVRKGIVLYFHGNRKNIERYAPFATNFTRNNYEVWMMDYPGFGKTTGKRTEQVMYDDAEQLYKMARGRTGKDSIIIYGKSIGTGVASWLASKKDCKRLILETPYYSIEALAKHYAFMYPVNRMTKYHFPIYQYFEKTEVPVTIFHGTNDETIPFFQAEMLMKVWDEIPSLKRELVAIEKGKHNNLNDFPAFHQKLDSLLQ